MFLKRIQLALIHVAIAMTLVPINSTLNRVMIKEMAISAALVSILASLPYIFSPTQMLIGSYSDRHPWFGYRRSPYIFIGLLLCVTGVVLAPQAVYLIPQNAFLGIGLATVVFGAWGMGFNIASVSYLSLASELSGEKGRTRTVSIMWFLMIVGIILTAATLSQLIGEYSPQKIQFAFEMVGLIAFIIGMLGLFKLEPRQAGPARPTQPGERTSWSTLTRLVLANPQARRFFLYLIILLAAILGQDVLLEPFAGEVFHLPVAATTRITSIWGGCVLVALLLAGFIERRVEKRLLAQISAVIALIGFLTIAASGLAALRSVFYIGVVLLGLGTGLSTVSNLSLMLDMTTTRVGLFIGAWGMADALARLVGTVTGGILRDVITFISQSQAWGYIVVFLIEAAMLLVSIFLIKQIDVVSFREQTKTLNLTEKGALMNDAS